MIKLPTIPESSKRATTIAVLMNKGGTGKTETSLNLALGLVQKGKKVLLIDFDPSSNLTSIILEVEDSMSKLGTDTLLQMYHEITKDQVIPLVSGYNALTSFLNTNPYPYGIGDVLNQNIDIEQTIMKTRFEHLDMIPSGNQLEITDSLLKTKGNNKALRNALLPLESKYDVIILDCQPFQNALTHNALCACYKENDLILCPIKINQGGLQGIQSTVQTVLGWLQQESLGYDLRILITMKNRNSVDNKWEETLRELFGPYILNSVIRYQAKPVVDASLNKKILLENHNSPVSEDYQKMVDEIYELIESNTQETAA